MNVVICDLDFHFQGQTFSRGTFALKKAYRQRMSPADLRRLARCPPWSMETVELLLLILFISLFHIVQPHTHTPQHAECKDKL